MRRSTGSERAAGDCRHEALLTLGVGWLEQLVDDVEVVGRIVTLQEIPQDRLLALFDGHVISFLTDKPDRVRSIAGRSPCQKKTSGSPLSVERRPNHARSSPCGSTTLRRCPEGQT